MYIIQASQKEIKKQFLVFKSSFEYCVLSWGVSDLQMNLNLDTMITLTFATFQKKIITLPTPFCFTGITCQIFHSYAGTWNNFAWF